MRPPAGTAAWLRPPDFPVKFDLPVPRYTSYPTAPHFTPGSAGELSRWLGELAPDEPVSLYLHVPFCDALCWFCGCHTQVAPRYRPVADYRDRSWRRSTSSPRLCRRG